MNKKGGVLPERDSYDQQSTGNRGPRRGRSSARQIHLQVLQDKSLPTERSLHSKLMCGITWLVLKFGNCKLGFYVVQQGWVLMLIC